MAIQALLLLELGGRRTKQAMSYLFTSKTNIFTYQCLHIVLFIMYHFTLCMYIVNHGDQDDQVCSLVEGGVVRGAIALAATVHG